MANTRKPQTSAAEKARRKNQSARAKGEEPERFEPVYAGEDEEVSSVSDFRRVSQGEKIRTPSGLVCMARRVGMEVLIRQGHIPNALMPIIRKWLTEGAAGKAVDEEKLIGEVLSDADQLASLMQMFDDVTMAVVVRPKILPVPTDPESGEPVPDENRLETDRFGNEIAYIDWVPFEDKSYLMNYAVGGTRDVERFRNEEESLATVLDGDKVQLQTERSPGDS
jgi:hypothetical protein